MLSLRNMKWFCCFEKRVLSYILSNPSCKILHGPSRNNINVPFRAELPTVSLSNLDHLSPTAKRRFSVGEKHQSVDIYTSVFKWQLDTMPTMPTILVGSPSVHHELLASFQYKVWIIPVEWSSNPTRTIWLFPLQLCHCCTSGHIT